MGQLKRGFLEVIIEGNDKASPLSLCGGVLADGGDVWLSLLGKQVASSVSSICEAPFFYLKSFFLLTRQMKRGSLEVIIEGNDNASTASPLSLCGGVLAGEWGRYGFHDWPSK